MSNESFTALARRVAPLFDRVEAAGVSSLTGSERVLLSVWAATGEIENGGFDQFFYNSSGDHAGEAPGAFRAIGAPGKAAVIEQALALFPGKAPPSAREERIAALDELTEREGEELFEALDSAFYAVAESVDDLLAAYVAAHEAEIAPPPEA
jgi:hypothetical protein